MPNPQLPEVCLNLWWFLDDKSGIVQRVAGRAYALRGTDEYRLQLLQALAATDFHLARTLPLPKQFSVRSEHGVVQGATTSRGIGEGGLTHFEHLLQAIEKDVPQQASFRSGRLIPYRLSIPNEPLLVVTCLLEHSDGRIEPQIKK